MTDSSRVPESRRRRTLLMAGIVFLAVFMPLAFGAVHPWAYKIGEALAFALMLLWPFGRAARDGQPEEIAIQLRTFAIPIVAFLAFALLQLIPLPPVAIQVLSPSTYRLYEQVFPGWPAQTPYAGLEGSLKPVAAGAASSNAATVVLPTVKEVKAGAPIPFAPKSETAPTAPNTSQTGGTYSDRSSQRLSKIYSTRWRPLSIAPELSWSGLIMFAACGALFVLVAFLPIGAAASKVERNWLVGSVVTVFIAVGLGIATIGLIQQATWNGRILWFFVPLDWGAPMLDVVPRASGPFVDPDHFAGFLAMIFPLAISGTFFGSPLVSARWSNGYRIACSVTSFVLMAAIILSQSRAGWIGLVLGVAMVMVLNSRGEEDRERATRSRRIAVAGAVGMLLLAMLFIGASGRSQVSSRVQNSVDADAGLPSRVNTWLNGLRMVEDFAAVGTGLRTWPELFTRYRARPWSELYFSEAHNDYLQMIAETGIVGLALVAWFLLRSAIFIYRRFAQLPLGILPIQAALVAALVVMCVVEFFDFDLQIPAIAFFFAMILGLAVRVSWAWTIDDDPNGGEFQPARGKFARTWVPIAAIAMLMATFVQPSVAYPYNLLPPVSPAQAKSILLLYPANTFSHEATADALGSRMPLADRLRERQIALALDPMNPYTRDAYMRDLAVAGRGNDALEQMELSVYNSPAPQTHPYMSDRLIGWLSPDERDAIERGITRATAEQVPGALEAAATFYDGVGKYSDEASLYASAAQHARDSHTQYTYLLNAASAASRGSDFKRAESLLQQAIAIEPDDTAAYYALTMNVYVPQKDVAGVKHTVAQAIDNGIDSYAMETMLAGAAQSMGDLPSAIAATKQIAAERPDSFDVMIRLGGLYSENHDFNQAVTVLTTAIQLRPDSAVAYEILGGADEKAYNYADADKAYARAAQLAPDNAAYKAHADDFHKRFANASAPAGTQTP
jgi:O-antigen ligase/tetratricopeptide (TPR) repeat protein